MTRTRATIVASICISLLVATTGCAPKADRVWSAPTVSRYVDPEGYFAIDIPPEFEIGEIRDTPLPSVSLSALDGRARLTIRISPAADDAVNRAIRCWETECREIDPDAVVTKTTVAGWPAVVARFRWFENVRLEHQLSVGDASHTVIFTASPEQFERILPDIRRSVESYVANKIALSPELVTRFEIGWRIDDAKKAIGFGHFPLARGLLKQVLEMQPDNRQALELMKQVPPDPISGKQPAATVDAESH